jgi:D-tyrosyl-tRNA(Tyr) deacylase
VVQRVAEARIRVDGEIVGEMGEGVLALVGVADGDSERDAEVIAEKLVHLRIFADDAGRMNRSLLEIGGSLGVVSQFTLLGDARAGRRPSFTAAARPELAAPLVQRVADTAAALGVSVVTGRFRAMMDVSLVNRGPVTLLLDSRRAF